MSDFSERHPQAIDEMHDLSKKLLIEIVEKGEKIIISNAEMVAYLMTTLSMLNSISIKLVTEITEMSFTEAREAHITNLRNYPIPTKKESE